MCHKPTKVSMKPHLATPVENVTTVDVVREDHFEPAAAQDKAAWSRSMIAGAKPKVLKKCRSLQSLLIPSFLHSPPAAVHPVTAPPKLFSQACSQSALRQPSSST